MKFDSGLTLAISAFAFYIIGGIGTFSGIALALFAPDTDLFGWGQGRGIGYLLLCVGLCLSVLGVLLMRIFRNRKLI